VPQTKKKASVLTGQESIKSFITNILHCRPYRPERLYGGLAVPRLMPAEDRALVAYGQGFGCLDRSLEELNAGKRKALVRGLLVVGALVTSRYRYIATATSRVVSRAKKYRMYSFAILEEFSSAEPFS